MQIIVAIFLLLISLTLFWAWQKRRISSDLLKTFAEIFTIVGGIAAIILFIIPTPASPLTDKFETNTPQNELSKLIPITTPTIAKTSTVSINESPTPDYLSIPILQPEPTIGATLTYSQKPIEVSSIVEVSLIDGSTFFAASPFVAYCNDNGLSFRSVYSNKLPIAGFTNSQDESSFIPFSDIMILQTTNENTHSEVDTIITDWDGETNNITFEQGTLQFLTDHGKRYIELSDITKIDFHPEVEKVIYLDMAIIENKSGEKTYAPIDSLSIQYKDQSIAGWYSFATNEFPLEPGYDLPIECIRKLHFLDNWKISGELIDGRSIEETLSTYKSLYLRGISQYGEFSLDMTDLKSIIFYRTIDQPNNSNAIIHLVNGQTVEVIGQTLQFDDYKWIPGVPVSNYRTYYFLEISSIKIDQPTDISELPTINIDLLSGDKIVGKFSIYESKNQFIGITPDNMFIQIPVDNINNIEFVLSDIELPIMQKAEIILDDDHLLGMDNNIIIAQANTIRIFSSKYGGNYPTTYTDKISTTLGVEIPISDIKSITYGDFGDNGYAIKIEKTDGSIIDSYNKCYGCFIGGLSDLGQFLINSYRISKINFNW